MQIPLLIHQTCKDEVPDNYKPYQASWKKFNPDHVYRLWTDVDIRELCEESFPWFLECYDTLRGVQRADAMRYMVMYVHGGVYADMDNECFKPIEELFATNPDAELWLHHQDNRNDIEPAFLASVPGHPFWPGLLKHIETALNDPMLRVLKTVCFANYVIETSGPASLGRFYRDASADLKQNVCVLNVVASGKHETAVFNDRSAHRAVKEAHRANKAHRAVNIVLPRTDEFFVHHSGKSWWTFQDALLGPMLVVLLIVFVVWMLWRLIRKQR